MKKIVSLGLILSLILGMSGISSASSTDGAKLIDESRTVSVTSGRDKDGEFIETVKEVSFDEAIQIVEDKATEANRIQTNLLLNSMKFNSLNINRTTNLGYYTVTRVYRYSVASVEMGALYQLYDQGSFRNIHSCVQKWSTAYGTGFHTWDQHYIADLTPYYPTNTSSIRARGNLTVAINASVEATIGAELRGMGFSFGGSMGSTIYFRKICDNTLVYTFR